MTADASERRAALTAALGFALLQPSAPELKLVHGWLAPGGKDVLQQGTVVVVSGQYGHDKPGPWTSLDWWTQLPIKLK